MDIISNMDKQTIAFDLDGTLIDVSIRDYQIYVDIINELGGLLLIMLHIGLCAKSVKTYIIFLTSQKL